MTTIWIIIALAAAVLGGLAVCMALVLGWANRTFAVAVDPRVDAVVEALPGANCGGCGYVGCGEYAEAVVKDGAGVNLCPVGGEAVAMKLAEILGVEVEPGAPYRPAVHCAATAEDKLGRNEYRGEATCAAANLVAGVQGCAYGCLALGDCVAACRYDAIRVIDGKTTIDYDACIGCGACETACPRHVISMIPFKADQMFVVACNNNDFGKDVRAVCRVGCIGCKACVRCGGGLFQVKDNVARIDYDRYEPAEVAEMIGGVLEKCPMKGIVKIGKPSAEDLAAVADEELPDVVRGEFRTTVDKTDWQG
jgi:RnfABCDGE-type electron transport complex B subunit